MPHVAVAVAKDRRVRGYRTKPERKPLLRNLHVWRTENRLHRALHGNPPPLAAFSRPAFAVLAALFLDLDPLLLGAHSPPCEPPALTKPHPGQGEKTQDRPEPLLLPECGKQR